MRQRRECTTTGPEAEMKTVEVIYNNDYRPLHSLLVGKVANLDWDQILLPTNLPVHDFGDNEKILDEIKKYTNSNPNTNVKDGEELVGTFSKIAAANKGISKPVHDGDILIKSGRSASDCTQCFWTKSADGLVYVPYNLSSDYGDSHLKVFQTAMDEYETLTCVRFVNRTTEKDYLNIVSRQGCYSYVGRIGGSQWVGLDTAGCMYRGTVQHELNHVLGFNHEHRRSDRDNYVTINYQYISPGDWSQFGKVNTNNLGLEYDFESVMHYESWAFSNTSGQLTIVPKRNPNVRIGQRDGISVLDVAKINRLYQCNVCATLHNKDSGILTSANYPSAYPHGANCVWLIRTPSGQVSLNFDAFDLQSSPNCKSDYVKIYDGPSKRSPVLLDKTCGTGQIPPIVGTTNQLLVEFSSDSSVAGVGFKASYSSVRCGGTFYTPNRVFTSPGHPKNYPPNLDCIYNITAPVGKKVQLAITDLELEDGRWCQYDRVEVTDGIIEYGPACGNERFPVLTSLGNNMVLRFASDKAEEYKGFKASYTFVEVIYNNDYRPLQIWIGIKYFFPPMYCNRQQNSLLTGSNYYSN
ncbi:embryonic protein UVS.2-like [Engystomops pustulosus]|uniref:embryonic protein UVS.2-like n=1 Tax=Engystomops pustulosus TaxID=76066 RepID=UPI003AFB3962